MTDRRITARLQWMDPVRARAEGLAGAWLKGPVRKAGAEGFLGELRLRPTGGELFSQFKAMLTLLAELLHVRTLEYRA